MFPLIGIPKTVAEFLESYRKVFCKEAGFQHISRYIKGREITALDWTFSYHPYSENLIKEFYLVP